MKMQFESIVKRWYNQRINAEWHEIKALNDALQTELLKIGYTFCEGCSTGSSHRFRNLATNKIVEVWTIGGNCTGESYYVPGISGHHAANGNELTFAYAK